MRLLGEQKMRYATEENKMKRREREIQEAAQLEENKLKAQLLEGYEIDKAQLFRESQMWRRPLEENLEPTTLKVIKENLARIYINALPMDINFKMNHSYAISENFKKELNEMISDDELLDSCQHNEFLSSFKTISEGKAQDIVDNLLSETYQRDIEPRELIIKECSFLSDMKMASEIIKDKVRWVVNEEQGLRKLEKDMINSLTESTQIIQVPGGLHRNLFATMMLESYQLQYSDNGLDKDMVNFKDMLNEAIMNYTLLETLNTLNIIDMDQDDIESRCSQFKL